MRPSAARAPAFGRVPLELLAVFLLDRAGVLAQLVEDRAVQVTVADVQIELGPHPSRAGEPNRVDYAAGSRGERIPVLRLSHLGGGEAILLAQVVYQPLEELAIRLLVFAVRARLAPRPVAGVLAMSLDMAGLIAVAIAIRAAAAVRDGITAQDGGLGRDGGSTPDRGNIRAFDFDRNRAGPGGLRGDPHRMLTRSGHHAEHDRGPGVVDFEDIEAERVEFGRLGALAVEPFDGLAMGFAEL